MPITRHNPKGNNENGDERFSPLNVNKAPRGEPGNPVVAVSVNTQDPREWMEIYTHAKEQCKGDEKIGCVIVEIIAPGAKEGRWIDYSQPQEGKDITVDLAPNFPGNIEPYRGCILIHNTGGPDTEYRYYPGIGWVCQ